MAERRALVVHGGWPGHEPAQATAEARALLQARGFATTESDTLESYSDSALPTFDLIVQCWTMGRISQEQVDGLSAAVRAGTGFAGWHGGIADSFRTRPEYLQLVGAQFVAHPGDFYEHAIDLVDDPTLPGSAIVAGLTSPVLVDTEQYWVLSDGYNDVLATTTLPAGPDTAWQRPITCPAVWTRQWGAGKVFVCTVGHTAADLRDPPIRTILDRGLDWASR